MQNDLPKHKLISRQNVFVFKPKQHNLLPLRRHTAAVVGFAEPRSARLACPGLDDPLCWTAMTSIIRPLLDEFRREEDAVDDEDHEWIWVDDDVGEPRGANAEGERCHCRHPYWWQEAFYGLQSPFRRVTNNRIIRNDTNIKYKHNEEFVLIIFEV